LKTFRLVQPEKVIKIANLRSNIAKSLANVWNKYIGKIVSKNTTRKYINQEQYALANLLYKHLTKENANPIIVQSYKTFLSNCINYVYLCEKESWTLYIIIFIFKLNSMLLEICNK
jgi:hypothetical protein